MDTIKDDSAFVLNGGGGVIRESWLFTEEEMGSYMIVLFD